MRRHAQKSTATPMDTTRVIWAK
uniref:Uncharacterized protein n=1 Tax=Arundo donax TaxID=35708 RepID=A0A0A9BAG2_ARUDO